VTGAQAQSEQRTLDPRLSPRTEVSAKRQRIDIQLVQGSQQRCGSTGEERRVRGIAGARHGDPRL
jgi:hypothetical protein